MCAYFGSIEVEDASGARFEIHKFESGRFWSRRIRFELETGEIVRRVDAHTFVILATGETLVVCGS